jgi:phosphoglycerate dehydrogenase-like enzyme
MDMIGINHKNMHGMRPTTARGAIVNEADLLELLATRSDVQAIIDVTDPESPSADSAFYDLPNIFLTPHIAGSLGSECRRMGRALVQEFHRFARGEPLQLAVVREQLARIA